MLEFVELLERVETKTKKIIYDIQLDPFIHVDVYLFSNSI